MSKFNLLRTKFGAATGIALALLALALFAANPTRLEAAGTNPGIASAKGSGSGGSGSSGSGGSGSDDKGSDDNGSGGNGSDDKGGDDNGSSSGSGSSGSGSSGSESSGSGSSGSGNSGSGSSTSGPSGSGSGPAQGSARTRSSRTRIEGKSRPIVNGFQAEFSVRLEARFDRAKFRAEVSNLNLGSGVSLAVCSDGSSMGNIVLNSLNFGELELDSRRGQSIPAFSGGETIELRRGSCGGELVASATLGGASRQRNQPGPPAGGNSPEIKGKSRRLINGFEAEFSVRLEQRAGRNKFRAEIENLNLGAGTRLDVCFQGGFLGDVFLNSLNSGELELDSRLGQNVPIFENGDTIELRLGGCGGEILISASFGSTIQSPNGAPRIEIEGKSRSVIGGFEAEFSVRFEQRFDRNKIRAEVSNLNRPEGSALAVCFEGTALGVITLNSLHFGELELDSRLGQIVPVLEPADVVILTDGRCGGAALMSVTIEAGN